MHQIGQNLHANMKRYCRDSHISTTFGTIVYTILIFSLAFTHANFHTSVKFKAVNILPAPVAEIFLINLNYF